MKSIQEEQTGLRGITKNIRLDDDYTLGLVREEQNRRGVKTLAGMTRILIHEAVYQGIRNRKEELFE